MKLPNTSFLQCVVVTATLLALPIEIIAANAGTDQSGDPGWPRERHQDGNRLIIRGGGGIEASTMKIKGLNQALIFL